MVNTPTIRPNDELLSLPTAAKELGVSRMTLYVWARAGDIPAREAAGRYLIRRTDLETFRLARARAAEETPL